MTNQAVRTGLDILSNGQNVEALRRLIVMSIIGQYLQQSPTSNLPEIDDSLTALLSKLPTKNLAEIASIEKGKTGIKDAISGSFPLVVTAEIRSSTDHYDFEGPGVMIPMVSSTGHGDASLKRIHFQDGQYAVGSILAAVHPKDPTSLSARYLHAYLSAFKDELLVSRMVGTANVSLTIAKLNEVPVPLIPIYGQRKIEELMALCDRLEAEQSQSSIAHTQLVETLLGTLTQSTDATDFDANWKRITAHFDTLFTTEASVELLEKTILQLAVTGKLVSQTIRNRSFDSQEGLDHSLPSTWKTTSLGKVANINGGFAFKSTNYSKSGIRIVRISDFDSTGFKDDKIVRYPYSDELGAFKLEPKNILMAMTGGTVGKSLLVKELPEPMVVNQRVATIKTADTVMPEYIYILIRTDLVQSVIHAAKNSTNDNISMSDIKNFYVPLPPLAEQNRIVAKVDELMTICSKLKERLIEGKVQESRLADTLIQNALSITA